MTTLEFVLAHASQIMMLCFGFGFLILAIAAVRVLNRLHRILKKIDYLSDVFVEYIQKPLQMIMQVSKVLSSVFGFFKG